MADYKALVAELSISDISDISGVPLGTVDRRVMDGTLVPGIRRGGGPGVHRRFSFMDAVALAVAAANKAMGPQWQKHVTKFVARLSPDQVDQAMREGRTMVVALPQAPWGMLVAPPGPDPELEALGLDAATQAAEDHKLTLTAALERVFRGVEQLASRPRNNTGRNRGLPGTRLNGRAD